MISTHRLPEPCGPRGVTRVAPRARWAFLLAAALCAGGGCRAAVYQELLESQNRELDQYLRQLEWDNEDLRSDLERCRQQGKSAKRPAKAADEEEAPPASSRRRRKAADEDSSEEEESVAPLVEEPAEADLPEGTSATQDLESSENRRGKAPPFKGPPVIQPPSSEIPEGHRPAEEADTSPEPSSEASQGKAAPKDKPSPKKKPSSEEDRESAPGADRESGQRAAPNGAFEIGLNPQGTGLVAASGRNRAGGLRLLVEPRDAEGRIVNAVGKVTVVVVDPSKAGAIDRIARWDFPADAVAMHFKRSAAGKGLHFDLTWPGQPPAVESLDVYVRLETPDGRKLVAEKTLTARGDSQSGRRWSRANPRGNSRGERTSTARKRPAPRDGEPTPADMGPDVTPR